jgi:bifunctional DNA-binding transcriptional regulator/antitoxin component of YhaV-PrlF toxin-antitoxin module
MFDIDVADKAGVVALDGSIILPFNSPQEVTFPAEGAIFYRRNKTLAFVTEDGVHVQLPDMTSQCAPLPRFSQGFAVVKDIASGKCGFINRRGQWVIPPRFREAWGFKDGMAIAFEEGFWIIDKAGSQVARLDVATIPHYHPHEQNGFLEFSAEVVRRDLLVPCVVKNFSEIALFADVERIRDCYDGVAMCEMPACSGKLCQLRTVDNKPIGADSFERTGFFACGVCPVKQPGRLWGAIDTSGQWVIPAEYDELGTFWTGVAAGRRGTQWRIVNRHGRLLFESEAERIETYDDGVVCYSGTRVTIRDFRGGILHVVDVN